METLTPNYHLRKQDENEFYSETINTDNMDIIDAELLKKVEKVAGKGLSTNDYTTIEKTKLSGIATGAQVNNITDVNVTDLTDGTDTTLHYHAADRNRANHTGTQTASTISDFASTVRTTLLTGLSTATNAAITAADTILTAFGKLQAQISTKANLVSPTFTGTPKSVTFDVSDSSTNIATTAYVRNLYNTIDPNDIEARREILDIKLKLDELNVIEFLNKTGTGFFDIFEDSANVDTVNTTATVASTDATFMGTKVLQMKSQTFSGFSDIELALYDKSRELFDVNVAVNNSATISMNITPGSRTIGEKFYYNGQVYTITNVVES